MSKNDLWRAELQIPGLNLDLNIRAGCLPVKSAHSSQATLMVSCTRRALFGSQAAHNSLVVSENCCISGTTQQLWRVAFTADSYVDFGRSLPQPPARLSSLITSSFRSYLSEAQSIACWKFQAIQYWKHAQLSTNLAPDPDKAPRPPKQHEYPAEKPDKPTLIPSKPKAAFQPIAG